MLIVVYRDTPKHGESDARWCGWLASKGICLSATVGHATPGEAAAKLGADEETQAYWNRVFPDHR